MAILGKWNGNFRSNQNGKRGVPPEGRPFVSENFHLIRAFHLHFNRMNPKFCLNGKPPRAFPRMSAQNRFDCTFDNISSKIYHSLQYFTSSSESSSKSSGYSSSGSSPSLFSFSFVADIGFLSESPFNSESSSNSSEYSSSVDSSKSSEYSPGSSAGFVGSTSEINQVQVTVANCSVGDAVSRKLYRNTKMPNPPFLSSAVSCCCPLFSG